VTAEPSSTPGRAASQTAVDVVPGVAPWGRRRAARHRRDRRPVPVDAGRPPLVHRGVADRL